MYPETRDDVKDMVRVHSVLKSVAETSIITVAIMETAAK
jgi:hypothetical protein